MWMSLVVVVRVLGRDIQGRLEISSQISRHAGVRDLSVGNRRWHGDPDSRQGTACSSNCEIIVN
jgi:hypothetical protein